MGTTADSSSNHHSPRGSGFPGDGVSSPQLRRKNLPSPWAQVVRGDSESIPAVHHSPSPPPSSPSPSPVTCIPEQASFSDCSPTKAAAPDNSAVAAAAAAESFDGNNGNAARPMKPAWKKPANGVVETSPVMGADSWPALSASTKASPKASSSSADSSSKTVVDGSVPTSQGPPVISHPPQKQVTTNANPNSNSNHNRSARQRSGKRGGGGGGGNNNSSGSGHSQSSFPRPPPQSSFPRPPPPPPPPPFPLFSIPPNGYSNLVPAVPDPSPREPPYRGNNWETRPAGGFVSQSHAMNDHRHSSRRGNYGSRGDGSYHSHFGGRRDQDRGNYANARDVRMQNQRAPPRGFVRPPPPNAGTFVPPQPVRPFGNPIGFSELLYVPTMPMEPFRGMPFISPPPPIIMPPEPPLHALLVHQIEYYFSDANLVKDDFLKSNMDVQGWVPISLIASFPRVKNLTNSIQTNSVQLILDSLRNSTVVEVQDDKMRRRNEWMKWIHNSGRLPTESGSLSPGGSSYDMLTNSVQKLTVDGVATNQSSMTGKATPYLEDVPGKRSSELTNQSQLSNGEDTEGTSSSPN